MKEKIKDVLVAGGGGVVTDEQIVELKEMFRSAGIGSKEFGELKESLLFRRFISSPHSIPLSALDHYGKSEVIDGVEFVVDLGQTWKSAVYNGALSTRNNQCGMEWGDKYYPITSAGWRVVKRAVLVNHVSNGRCFEWIYQCLTSVGFVATKPRDILALSGSHQDLRTLLRIPFCLVATEPFLLYPYTNIYSIRSYLGQLGGGPCEHRTLQVTNPDDVKGIHTWYVFTHPCEIHIGAEISKPVQK